MSKIMAAKKRIGMKQNGTSKQHKSESDGETLKRLLTPNSVAVIERMSRDHGLGTVEVIRMAVDEVLEQFEEDLATRGGISGGENEWYFVHEAAGRTPKWDFSGPTHKVGSVSFYHVFDRDRIAKLGKLTGTITARRVSDKKGLYAVLSQEERGHALAS